MGSEERRKFKKETREKAAAEIEGHRQVVKRCGESWARAYQELLSHDVKFLEFADSKFDCRECPLFMECLTKNHFSRRNWVFEWLENNDSAS